MTSSSLLTNQPKHLLALRTHWACGLMVLVCLAAAVHGDETPSEQATTPRSPTTAVDPALAAKIRRWIVQLDDDQYAVRERAQSQLESAGLAALDPVAEVARVGPLESSTRALNILLSWSESTDTDHRIRALERIALLENRKTESELATRLLAEVREQAALRAIVAYGARVERDIQLPRGPNLNVAPVQVIIGEQWKGGTIGILQLTAIRGLTTVSFYSTPLDDRALAVLPQLSSVRRIEIYGPELSPQATKRLTDSLPAEVALDIRSGAQLGVRGDPVAQKALIRSVEAGSAAETAGLQSGDIVLEVDGAKVANFFELTRQIAKHEPDDTVVLKLSRNGETLEKEVTFDRWGIDSPSRGQRAKVKISTPIVPPNNLQLDRR